ncbi:molecular chaperone DnaJ [Flavobacterium sp. N1994]|uniref:molecular chaperone DnaJ n=1 Tax=Flavobacterium sp. N1994 TaxID=2986827 RepID=UPI0022226EDF|nr:molecular chaperone DnaJ [Flavobacterium sp. N1994]
MISPIDSNKKIILVEKITLFNSVWFWIAIVELAVILFLIHKLKRKMKVSTLSDLETKNIKNSKKSNVDMDNLINSIHNSRTLYKELSKKCHPDKFINDSKQKVAEEIFQEITKNERNFEKLNALKLRAINELNINF